MAKIQVTQDGKVLVTQNGGVLLSNTSELATKTITENGTYLASTDNVDGYSEVTVNVSGGGSGSGTTDVPLTRISDDNGNEIGTHYMNFEDANGNKFKVICLDAQYRNASTKWCSTKVGITDLPMYYYNYGLWWYDNAKETATQNTQASAQKLTDAAKKMKNSKTAGAEAAKKVFNKSATFRKFAAKAGRVGALKGAAAAAGAAGALYGAKKLLDKRNKGN